MLVEQLPTSIYESPIWGIDIETTVHDGKQANPWQDRVLSVQLSDGVNTYILTDHYEQLIPLLTSQDHLKIFHNALFDVSFLNYQLGIVTENIWDTLIVERVMYMGDKTRSNKLSNVLARRLGVVKDESVRQSFFDHQGDFTKRQLDYMATDVVYLPEIRRQQLEEVGRMGMGRVIALENRVVPVTVHMYLEGVGFDLKLWEQYEHTIQTTLRERVMRMASYLNLPVQSSLFSDALVPEINFNSTKQKQWLFENYGIQAETTQAPELEEILASMEQESKDPDNDPRIIFLRDYLFWANWNKMGQARYPDFINPVTGRIHPKWNQTGTVTGRFSGQDPNMQNVRARPAPGEPDMRLLFLPQNEAGESLDQEEHIFVVSDYGQQEPRIMAQICGDPNMIHACNQEDVYVAFGELTLGREITKAERQMFKQGVLAAGYGAGVFKLQRVLNLSEEDTQGFYQNLQKTFPQMFSWGDRQAGTVMRLGYNTTLLGRRRWWPGRNQMPDWMLRNESRNMPIQGTAADMMKLGMVKLYEEWIKPYKPDAAIAIQVHDELVVRTNREIEDYAQYQVISAMEMAGREICPDVTTPVEGDLMHRWTKNEDYSRDRYAELMAEQAHHSDAGF
ncbi:MAG TPA: DNA polymerase [Bellilinea sp.]|nr:DNA polymerase [Bellilinea sp.]